MAQKAAPSKYTTEWFQGPLPPTERSYGVHVNYGQLGEKDKITYGAGNLAIIRDVENPNEIQVFDGHQAKVRVVMAAPNGRWIASGDETGVVHIYGYPQLALKNTLRIGSCINDLRWSPDSAMIVAAGNGSTEFAKAFRFDASNPLGKIDRITKQILSVDWSTAGPKRVATSDEDMTVNFYHGVPFKYDSRTLAHTRYPNVLRYSPDGKYFATVGSDAKIFLYDGATGAVVRELTDADTPSNNHTGGIFGLAWFKDSAQLVTASADRTIKVWDVEGNKVVHTWTSNANTGDIDDQQAGVMVSPSGDVITINLSGTLSWWTRESATPKYVQFGHNQTISAVAFSRATGTLYTGCVGGRIAAWNVANGSVSWLVGGQDAKGISALAVSADGSKLYSAGFDNVIRQHDATNKVYGNTVAGQTKNLVRGIAVHPKNADSIVAATSAGDVILFVNGNNVAQQNCGDATRVVYSPQGDKVVVGAGKKMITVVYDTDGVSKLVESGRTANEYNQPVDAVDIDPTGTIVASNQKNDLILWNKDYSAPLGYGWSYHLQRITDMKFSPSGKYIVSVGQDKNLIIWQDLNKFKPKNILIGDIHPQGLYAVEWVDDETLVTIGDQGTIKRIKITVPLALE